MEKMGYGPGGIFSFSLAATIKHRAGARFHICCVLSLALAGAGCGGTVLETKQLADISRSNFDGAYISYFLPRGEIPVTVSFEGKEKKILSLSYDPTPKIVPDFSRHYHVVYNHAPLSTDNISIQTDSNGLLKEVSSTTTDQSVDLVKGVNSVLTQVAALQKAIETEKLSPVVSLPVCTENLKTVVKVDLTYMLKPERVEQWSSTCKIVMKVDIKLVESLEARGFPKGEEISGPPNCTNVVCFRILGAYRVNIEARLYSKDGKTPIEAVGGGPVVATAEIEAVAPMPAPLGFVRFNRRSFVENMTTATFTNGMLTGFKAKDPSELVGFLTLPTEVLKTTTLLIQL